jgi:hypothetical protein
VSREIGHVDRRAEAVVGDERHVVARAWTVCALEELRERHDAEARVPQHVAFGRQIRVERGVRHAVELAPAQLGALADRVHDRERPAGALVVVAVSRHRRAVGLARLLEPLIELRARGASLTRGEPARARERDRREHAKTSVVVGPAAHVRIS